LEPRRKFVNQNSTMATFDPNGPAPSNSGIFGLPFARQDAAIVLLPVPWEATTSYGGGTSLGPSAIFEASKQVDLYDVDVQDAYAPGIFMQEAAPDIAKLSATAKAAAQEVITAYGELSAADEARYLDVVNTASTQLNAYVRLQTANILKEGRIAGIVGGDHSVPLGAFHAVAEAIGNFGILHFDAHSDTRIAYEGFKYSHASIMYNALQEVPKIEKLVQVGIRDMCAQEVDYCASTGARVSMWTDRKIVRQLHEGTPFATIARAIVDELPKQVWVSFDIDGLDPRFCPNTGTPVPGGLDFQQAITLLRELVLSGRKIIGFDLNEVAPSSTDLDDEWDANVGARLLYKLCGFTFASQQLCKLHA
jgi:agmatinase